MNKTTFKKITRREINYYRDHRSSARFEYVVRGDDDVSSIFHLFSDCMGRRRLNSINKAETTCTAEPRATIQHTNKQ
jgi:hypothetical protein